MRAQWRRHLRYTRVLEGIKAWRGRDGKTWIRVAIERPHPATKGQPRYLFTTEATFLDPTGFPDPGLRQKLAYDAAKPRRRALFCWDRRKGLTLAALSFHVDKKPSVPLVVTDLAIREDEYEPWSLFAMWMLLDVLQDVAVKAPHRADDEVGAIAQDRHQQDRLEALGLRPCPTPPALQQPGTWYCYRRTRPTT